jgi:hypothetical protein
MSERLARLRSVTAFARLCFGPRGRAFAEALRQAETDETALEPALRELGAPAALDRRQVRSSFAALPQRGR